MTAAYDDAVERVARALYRQSARMPWHSWEATSHQETYRMGARRLLAQILPPLLAEERERAAKIAEIAPYNRGGMVCGCSEGLADWTADAIRNQEQTL